jgi:hypothetical protein
MFTFWITTFDRKVAYHPETIHRVSAPRTEWSLTVDAGRFPDPERPSVLLRLCRLPVTRQLLLGLCLGCYKAGIFFLKLFDTLHNHLELFLQKPDASVLDVAGPKAAQGCDEVGHNGH